MTPKGHAKKPTLSSTFLQKVLIELRSTFHSTRSTGIWFGGRRSFSTTTALQWLIHIHISSGVGSGARRGLGEQKLKGVDNGYFSTRLSSEQNATCCL